MDATENTSEMVNIVNASNGKVGQIRRSLFNNDFFNPIINTETGARNLVEVKPGTKPYIPETYKAKDADEFAQVHPDKVKSGDKPNDEK